MVSIDDLRAFPLLATLDAATLADTARRAQRCSFRPGQQIMLEGEQAPGLFLVLRGRVQDGAFADCGA